MQKSDKGQIDITSDEPSLTPEQAQRIIQIGEQASQLLNAPVFQMAYQKVMDDKYLEWLSTQPKEREKREGLYHEVKGLASVTELFQTAVRDAQDLLQMQQDAASPERQQQEYMNNQGFGLN